MAIHEALHLRDEMLREKKEEENLPELKIA